MTKDFTFTEDVERDARLVRAGMLGGFSAVCAVAMHYPEFKDGPDAVLAHAKWLKKRQPYIAKVADAIADLEVKERAA